MVRESPSWTLGAWEDPDWREGTARSRARLLDFIFIRGPHAGGSGVEDGRWKSCTNVLLGWTCISRGGRLRAGDGPA